MKKYKYRVKDLSNDIGDVFKCHKVVQVKKWYGWVTILYVEGEASYVDNKVKKFLQILEHD